MAIQGPPPRSVTRRRVLASLAAASAPLAVPAVARARAAAAGPVVVIGAGIAGLAAASRLARAGVAVVVVEAGARIGGRIWTSRAWPGLPIDLGASWIHGLDGNPVTALARAAGLAMVETDYDSAVIHGADGAALSAAACDRLDAIAETLFYGLEDAIDACRPGNPPGDRPDRRSVADAVAALFDLPAMSRADRRLLDFLLASVIEHDLAADVADLGLCLLDSDEDFAGPDAILPAGYDAIAHGLASGLDIRLRTPALGLTLTPAGVAPAGVTVETSAGRIDAAAVVVTLPLGVLQAGALRFDPPLPGPKQAAIHDLGSGLLDKAVLRFPRVFWDRDAVLLQFVSDTPGLWAETLNLAAAGPSPASPAPSPVRPPVLVGFNAGSAARALEPLSDRDTVASMMAMLRTIYGSGVPGPEAWQITRWAADPLALGAYSYEPPAATPATRAALAAPVAARLFFAGEATSESHPATVHGALLSGWRAADEVLG